MSEADALHNMEDATEFAERGGRLAQRGVSHNVVVAEATEYAERGGRLAQSG